MTTYVYVAGPLSDMPAVYLANVARLSRLSRDLCESGYVVVNPAADMLEGLMSPVPWPLSLYQARSVALMALLEGRTGAVLVDRIAHDDGRMSGGVAAEVAEAARLCIPVFYERASLDGWRACGDPS